MGEVQRGDVDLNVDRPRGLFRNVVGFSGTAGGIGICRHSSPTHIELTLGYPEGEVGTMPRDCDFATIQGLVAAFLLEQETESTIAGLWEVVCKGVNYRQGSYQRVVR